MLFRFLKRINANAGIFNGHFVDVKALYAFEFNTIPCITFIGDINVTEAFAFIKDNYGTEIEKTFQHAYFNHDDKKVYFNNTIVVLTSKRMIEIAGNYCQLLHTKDQYNWANKLVNNLAQFKAEVTNAPAFTRTQIIGFAKKAAMN